MLDRFIEELLCYAKYHLDFSEIDYVYTRNILMHEFNVLMPYEGEIDEEWIKSLETPDELINKLKEDIPEIDSFEIARIMGLVTPKPSELVNKFNSLKENDPVKACDYFYDLMIKNNYVKLTNIRKNIKWNFETDNNYLEITINLSKPEKNNKDIAKQKDMVLSDYPKCMLCDTNEGYYGSSRIQPRSDIRVIPMKLNQEDWFMQYSPYAYYDEHAIVINKNHVPMAISKRTVENELAYLDILPNYFIGSNSDLPIVGGSMLYHEHFQAGKHLMPMMFSRDRYTLKSNDYPNVKISYLDWYNSCLTLKSNSKEDLVNLAGDIIDKYLVYSDEEIDLIASDKDGRHNAITIISRKIEDEYCVYLIFRNNRCNEEYPDGIFHAHPEYHNIKKEGIGLIEAMGLYILPARLKNELSLISEIISSPDQSIKEFVERNRELGQHLNFINKLVIKYGRKNSIDASKEIIKYEVGIVCENILRNTGIFKDTIDGQLALMKFFEYLGVSETNE